MGFLRSEQQLLWRHGFMLLLLLAFALRAFIPAGYMPSFNNQGVYSLTICSSDGGRNMVLVDKDNQPIKPHKQQPPCVYAVGTDFTMVHVPVAMLAAIIDGRVQQQRVKAFMLSLKQKFTVSSPRSPPII
ncbi:MAG: hypothetical protein ACOYK8_07390 [Alphaproteobacteria bacterium]